MKAIILFCIISYVIAANPDGPRIEGIKKLNEIGDCTGPVAFSALQAKQKKGTIGKNDLLTYVKTLNRQPAVGFSRDTGIFTVHCPGLYEIAFTASGADASFSLRKRPSSKTTSWSPIVSTPKNGGSQVVIFEMEFGEQLGVVHEAGPLGDPSTFTFSAFRLATKK